MVGWEEMCAGQCERLQSKCWCVCIVRLSFMAVNLGARLSGAWDVLIITVEERGILASRNFSMPLKEKPACNMYYFQN